MYIPAAINPYRYRLAAWLSVLARPPGIVFFFLLYPNTYPLFGVIDLLLTLVQFPLLLLTFYGPARAPSTDVVRLAADDGKSQPPGDYHGTSFNQLKRVVWSDPYDTLPYHVGLGPIKLVRFFNDSSRNLSDKRDLLPYYDKLIHANGISFTGIWEITEPSPYTGYFAQNRRGLLLLRGSVAGLTLNSGTRRAFGFGGKIFPTLDPDEVTYPANFVAVSHLSGVRTRHITDIEMTNQPTIGLGIAPNLVNRVIFRLLDTRPGLRQVHAVATLGLDRQSLAVTPDLVMFKAAADTPRVDKKDFRDELRLEHYPNRTLVYDIFVRNMGEVTWNRLGKMTLTDYSISESGDKRLHFWIPRDRTQ